MSFVYVLFVFTVVIGLHEYGHFLAARLCGMRVLKFAVGFGPQLRFTPKEGGTEYALGLIPLGGYEAIAGMNKKDQDVPGGFYSKSRLAQVFVLAAGVLVNFLLAFVLMTAALFLVPSEVTGEKLSFLDGLSTGFAATIGLIQVVTVNTVEFIGGLLTFSVNPAEEIVGPAGIASLSAEAGNAGLVALLGFMALLSIAVGVTNILPIPPLDGGKVAIVAIEALRNRSLPDTAVVTASLIGMGFLLTLFVLGTIGDVMRLIN